MNVSLFLKYFSRVLMLLLVLPLSNMARGIVAKKMGDTSAEEAGRITLDPFAHLDMLGSLMILLIGFGWSKPMPINPNRMNNPRKGILMVSITGPLTYFAAAVVCILVQRIMLLFTAVCESVYAGGVTPAWCILLIFSLLSNINVCLGVIHLLPLPPMDGFNILHHFAGYKFNRWYYNNYRQIHLAATIIIIVLFTLPDQINPLIYLIDITQHLLGLLTAWIPVGVI